MDFGFERSGCTVVFGEEMADKFKFASGFLSVNKQFKTNNNPKLTNPKKKLFGKYKSAADILLEDLSRADRKSYMEIIVRESEGIALNDTLYRAPRAMTGGQIFRWSVLFDALMGKRCFFFSDDVIMAGAHNVRVTVKWLKKYAGNAVQIVWLTGLSREKLADDEYELKELADRFLEISGDELIPADKSEIFAKPEPEPEPKPEPKPVPKPVPKPEPEPVPEQKPQNENAAKILAMRNAYINKKQ